MIIDSKQYNGSCSCGRAHKMSTEFCIIEKDCLKKIHHYLKEYGLGGFTVAIYDENTYQSTADRHPSVDAEVILPAEDLHANEHGVKLLSEKLPRQAGCLIAIGSGTIHDIVRYCAYERKIDFVSCPTAASVDGFCSSVAAMTWHGCKKTLTAVAPKIVLADLGIIQNAPIRLTKSGFGDMVGKYISLTDWKIANILTGEYFCDRIAQMTLSATEAVMDSIDGIIVREESAYEKLIYGLLLSGLAMQMIGNSRPASGAEHHISHFIEMQPVGLEVGFDALHGEKVGVGTLLVMKRYQRLLGDSIPEFCDYSSPSDDVMKSIFGPDRFQEINNENKDDAAKTVTGKRMREKWQEISYALSILPDVYKLEAMYENAGVASKLQDIGASDTDTQFLLQHAPLVRNRLTLLRLISRGVL